MPVLDTIDRYRVTTFAVTTALEILTHTPADPFGLDHDCLNPSGHDFVACCGEVACQHCARIAWR